MEGCFRLEPVVTHALGCCSARPASAHFKWNAYSDEDWEGFSDFNPDDSVPDKPEECASVLNPPPNHRLFTTNYATKENLLADLHEFCCAGTLRCRQGARLQLHQGLWAY